MTEQANNSLEQIKPNGWAITQLESQEGQVFDALYATRFRLPLVPWSNVYTVLLAPEGSQDIEVSVEPQSEQTHIIHLDYRLNGTLQSHQIPVPHQVSPKGPQFDYPLVTATTPAQVEQLLPQITEQVPKH